MLSNENHPPDPSSCPSEILQLNCSSTDDDQQPSGVLQSDLLISCPKFTIRDYAFSNRRKDIKTNWPFSEKSLQLCLNRGVKDLLPPFQSLDAVKIPVAQRCTIGTSSVSNGNQYNLIDQASRLTSLQENPSKSEGVRIFSSMVVEAETSFNYSASKPVKKHSLAGNIMKPLTKKCRERVMFNNIAGDQNKLENNASKDIFVSETIVSKVCPVCKTFTSSSNTTLNAHIDQCLSGESVGRWSSDPNATKSRIKPKRMRTMVDIYETAQYCTIEELERRNGTNLALTSSLPAQDITEVGYVERKRKSLVDFEEIENEAAGYVDVKGTKLRILSKFNDLSSPVMAEDDTGTRKREDGEKKSKLCLGKKKKKKLHEKQHKLQIRVSDSKKLCSPRHQRNSQINIIQENSSVPEVHLDVEEALTKPQRAHDLIKYIEPESEDRRVFYKRPVLTKMNDKGDHLHLTWTREKKPTSVTNGESPRYSYVNGSCGSMSNKSIGTVPSFCRSSKPCNDYVGVVSLRRSVRDPLGEGYRKELNTSDSSVKCKNKDESGNNLNPISSLSIQKVKMKRVLTRNASYVGDNSKHFPDGHDLSSKSRGFSSFTRKLASRLSNPQASTPKSTFGPKGKRSDIKKPHSYCESKSDDEEIEWQTVANISKNVTADRRELKVSRDSCKIKVSGKGETLVFKGMSSTSQHCAPQIDGINDSYSDNVTSGSDDEKESVQNNVQPWEKVVDEATSNNPLFEAFNGFCKSSDGPCHEMAGHLDDQSESRGYMEFCDGPSLGTEDARYPVESILDGGEKMFYTSEGGKSMFGQNGHATTELHSIDGSDCYYDEFDLIPIPGPPGSFLPSPSSNEFHGNSTPTSRNDQSSGNPHDFAGRDSSDSPSPTSTISNSDIGKFDSSLVVRLPFRHSIQDVMRSSACDASGTTMADKIYLDPSAAFAVDFLYKEHATPLELKNDQPCCCSRKDGSVLSSAVFNSQDTSLLSWPSMPSAPEVPFNTQASPDETSRAKICNVMLYMPSSGHLAGEIHNAIEDPRGLIPIKACTNSGTPSPSTSNPVFRLMGKDLMVVSKEEASYSRQAAKEIMVIDDASESSADLATHGMSVMNHRGQSIKPELMASEVSPRGSNYQPKTSHSGSLGPSYVVFNL